LLTCIKNEIIDQMNLDDDDDEEDGQAEDITMENVHQSAKGASEDSDFLNDGAPELTHWI